MDALLWVVAGAAGLLALVASAVARALVVDEAKGQISRRLERDLERTINKLPEDLRDEWADEWRAELEAVKSTPLTAVRLVHGLRQSARELSRDAAQQGDVPGVAAARDHLRLQPRRKKRKKAKELLKNRPLIGRVFAEKTNLQTRRSFRQRTEPASWPARRFRPPMTSLLVAAVERLASSPERFVARFVTASGRFMNGMDRAGHRFITGSSIMVSRAGRTSALFGQHIARLVTALAYSLSRLFRP